ncbi:endonuclease VII domain-containing protein [Micromonospora purpureochromogenes]|uniref:endonuclease VII domain-containing protein n=1 Tax=Micromonospora purpureochromogenes TaxID=47872 RepID=UPI0033D2082F
MNLRTKYGITQEEYDARRAAQDHRCAICGVHEEDIPASTAGRPRMDGKATAAAVRLVVDHCRSSKRVRGLLCTGCNAALGHFRDSPETLTAALRYLREA